MSADAWAIHFGANDAYRCCTFDLGKAPEIAARLHGTVHPMVYLEKEMQQLDARSERNLNGVHTALAGVMRRARELVESRGDGLSFIITEGLRTRERQVQLVRAGASRTMDSRHLTGHAVDVAATVEGDVRWDWPLYGTIAGEVKKAAAELGVQITWGGDWPKLRDGPHFELDPQIYSA